MPVKPFKKKLSRTDVGESKTHQSGIFIPVADGERLFPESMRRQGGTDFKCQDHTGHDWTFRFYHRAKESESRITHTTDYIKQYLIRAGDKITLHAPDAFGAPYRIEFAYITPAPIEGEESLEGFKEGGVRIIRVNKYERDPRNREKALKHHGVRCFGCRLTMAEMYGEIAQGYIHIHHATQLSSINDSQTPDINELVPLCPNCHAVVHLADPPLTIKRLKELVLGMATKIKEGENQD